METTTGTSRAHDCSCGVSPVRLPYHAGGTIVFRRTAVDTPRDILDAHGELLPVKEDGGVELFVYNARALDALPKTRCRRGSCAASLSGHGSVPPDPVPSPGEARK